MRVEYDPEADAAEVYLTDESLVIPAGSARLTRGGWVEWERQYGQAHNDRPVDPGHAAIPVRPGGFGRGGRSRWT